MLFTALRYYSKGFMFINSQQYILLTILWGRYYCPHSTDENTDVRGASSRPVTKQVSIKGTDLNLVEGSKLHSSHLTVQPHRQDSWKV